MKDQDSSLWIVLEKVSVIIFFRFFFLFVVVGFFVVDVVVFKSRQIL